jgi:type II secretory pathway component GspD/PulD (secretin)
MTMTCEARRKKFTSRFMVVALMVSLAGLSAVGQTTEKPATVQTTEKPATSSQDSPYGHVDTRPLRTFYLSNSVSQNEANEITVAIRNTVDPGVRIYLLPSMNALVARATSEQMDQVQKLINELDRPKKAYRLTYTITEIDGGKRVGVQHFSMVLTEGQRTVMKQGSKVPVVTGSYNSGSAGAESQVTFIDVGMNFDATLDPYGNGARLKSKVEQLGIAEEKSGVGPQDPIVRQTAVEGTVFLTAGKPVVIGSLDVPGSTRHLDVDVMMEVVP